MVEADLQAGPEMGVGRRLYLEKSPKTGKWIITGADRTRVCWTSFHHSIRVYPYDYHPDADARHGLPETQQQQRKELREFAQFWKNLESRQEA